MVARLKLKEIDGRAPPGVNAVNSAPESSPMKRVVVLSAAEAAGANASPRRRRPGRHLQTAGELLKLALRTSARKGAGARLIASRDVTTREMQQWTIRSQAPTGCPSRAATGKVQRLDGGGCSPRAARAVVKIKSDPAGNGAGIRNGSLRLNLTQHGETHQVQTR